MLVLMAAWSVCKHAAREVIEGVTTLWTQLLSFAPAILSAVGGTAFLPSLLPAAQGKDWK